MSWQAMHRVVMQGPVDDGMFRLLIVVADFADAGGRNATVAQRVMAERCHLSVRGVRHRLNRAVAEGWLVVDNAGGPRRQAVYSLGELSDSAKFCAAARPSARRGRTGNETDMRGASYSERQQTSNEVGRTRTARRLTSARPPSAGDKVPPAAVPPGQRRAHPERLDTGRIDPATRHCPDCEGRGAYLTDDGVATVCAHPQLLNGQSS